MRLNHAVLAVSLSLVCLSPAAMLADTLTLTGTGGASSGGVSTYPYYFTVTGVNGTAINVELSCLNFDREIYTNETWTVTEAAVSSIGTNGLDGESQKSYIEDAYLYNLYAGASAQQTSDIQFAIWAIMDPSVATQGTAGYTSNAAHLDSLALAAYNSGNLSFDANDYVFIPTAGGYPEQDGQPQIFMVDPLPSVVIPPHSSSIAPTPEPSGLLLLGTGMFGAVAFMRRRLANA